MAIMMLDGNNIVAISIVLAELFSTTLVASHHHHHPSPLFSVQSSSSSSSSSAEQLLVASSLFRRNNHLRRLSFQSGSIPSSAQHKPRQQQQRRRGQCPRRFLSNNNMLVVLHDNNIGNTLQQRDDCKDDADPQKKKIGNYPQHLPSPLSGMPVGPSSLASNTKNNDSVILLRYMYEGVHLSQGRLCFLDLLSLSRTSTTADGATEKATSANAAAMTSVTVTIPHVIQALRKDGVDFNLFYACAYESQCSTGGWLPLESAPRHQNPWVEDEDDGRYSSSNNDSGRRGDITTRGHHEPTLTFTIPTSSDRIVDPSSVVSAQRRIDIKLFRRPKIPTRGIENDSLFTKDDDDKMTPAEYSKDALRAISASVPCGKLSIDGYFGIGILHPKACENVGTLWRTAYQLGASILYTIGGRYKSSSTDTLNVPARIPLIELDDWNSFVEWASPKAAVWVVIEMGGTPLSEFVHPRNAIYILGSEDHGVPTSVLRGCKEVVSLECELYGSYNVAVAGSIVMYDRMMKMRREKDQMKRKKHREESG